jgi:hypothetical protein
MLRSILLGIHCLFAIGLAMLVVTNPKQFAAVATLPLLLVLGVLWGLVAQGRFVIVPSVILAMLATALAGAMVIGNIAWSEQVITQVILSYLLFLATQIAVIVLAFTRFGRRNSSVHS